MNEERNYYLLPWYKKYWFKTYDWFRNKFHSFKFPWIKFSIFVIIILIIFVIASMIVNGKTEFKLRPLYDKSGFVEYKDLDEVSGVLENDLFKFTIDYETTHFELYDKQTDTTWLSKPKSKDKMDPLVVYYSQGLGVAKPMGVYGYSVDYEGNKRYMIRYNQSEQSIEVLYMVGGKIKIDYTDLPQLISIDRFENYVIKNITDYISNIEDATEKRKANLILKKVQSCYKESKENGYYSLNNGSELSTSYLNDLYKAFYTYAGYTQEDFIRDNQEFGVNVSKIYPYFEISLKYSLCSEGLQIELVNDSLLDTKDAPLVYIDVLPYFGCASIDDYGYSLIPDGSGIIIDYNNNRSYASRYEQRIYGKELAKFSNAMTDNVNKISLALYGINVNDKGLLNIIETGAESCSLIANVLDKKNSGTFNQTYYRYFNRESDSYRFVSSMTVNEIITWTNDYNTQSLKLLVKSVPNDGSYSEMAKIYQNYLVQNELLSKQDDTDDTVLDLTLLGGFLEKTNFLGIPYTRVSSLTKAEEIKLIIDELLENDVDQINVFYEGFANDGIKGTYSKNLHINNSISSKNDLKELTKYLLEKNIDLYPLVRANSAFTKKDLGNDDFNKTMYGYDSVSYDYDETIYLADGKSTGLYMISANSFDKTLQGLTNYQTKIGTSNMAFIDFGSDVYGSYQNRKTMFRSEMVSKYIVSMDNYQSSFTKISTTLPNDYALKYTSVALNIPTCGTNYQIAQTSVPFYQMVLSGYIDYSTEAINLNDQYTFDYYKMKLIEQGSNIAMTWTYSDTIDLIGTEFDNYYSTYYKNWINKTITLYQDLNSLGIAKSSIKSHQILDYSGKVTKTTYENGLEVVLNYTNSNFVYDGISIPANSYLKVKEGR